MPVRMKFDMWARLRSSLDAIVHRSRFEDSLSEEIEGHLQAHAGDLIRRGASQDEALRQSRLHFGSIASVQDRCREASGLRLTDELRQDIRVGWRLVLKAPLASAVALGTISVATGLVILTAALVYSVLLRPLPFVSANRVMAIQPATNEFEALDLRAFQNSQTSFEQVHGYFRRSVTLAQGDTVPESLQAGFVTAGVFDMLGAQPILGRTFREGEDFTANINVIVIGEQLWRARFGADPAILERDLEIDGRQLRVVGVMPANIRFPVDEDAWLPMDFALPTADNPGSGRSFSVFGRLRETVPIETADAEARLLFTQIWGEHESAVLDQVSPTVSPFADRYLQAGFSWLLLVTGLAAGGVLLVACANVANLTLARTMSRRVDVAVRMALGAGRRRVVRQFATESLVLAVPGTLVGLWTAALGLRLFERFQPSLGLPYWTEIRLDTPILLLAGCLTITVAVSASLVPALRATRPSEQASMTMPQRGTKLQSRRATSWLVASQVAGSCAFLIAAGLLVKSSLSVEQINLGFDPSRVLTGQLALPAADYAEPSATMLRLLQEMDGSAVVESASLVRLAPGTGPAFAWTFAVEGAVYGPERPHPSANGLPATHGFFETMDIDIVEGRDFTPGESRYGTDPVLIANRTLAERYLGPNPLGRRIQIGSSGDGPWLPVIGIVSDTYIGSGSGGIGLDTESRPQLYLSWGAAPYSAATLVVRTASDASESVLPAVRQTIAEVAPTVALRNAGPLTDAIEESTWAIRLFGLAFTVFGGITLLMCAVGLFGVMAFAVKERTREIGVRIALGAGPLAVLRLVATKVAAPVPLGLALGIGASIPLVRSLQLLLFDVPPTDAVVYLLVVASLVLAAVLATCGPVIAATRINPVIVLRTD